MKPLAGAGATPKSNIGGALTGGFTLAIQADKPLVSLLPGDSIKLPERETFFQKKKREEIERLESEIV